MEEPLSAGSGPAAAVVNAAGYTDLTGWLLCRVAPMFSQMQVLVPSLWQRL